MATVETLPGAAPYPPELVKRMTETMRGFGADYTPRTRHLREDGRAKYTNRLVLETSPYLRQHAHNPVNWYPWGDEAFEAARRLKRPVLLSVGYSTCHWCHVMEEKSFENEAIARYLNENYVAIKVDREVRPDIDSLYMASIYSFSRSGGWPMTVWLTPDRKPFYGGTYFPPEDMRMGERSRPGFLTILREMKKIYDEDPEEIADVTTKVMANIQSNLVMASGADLPTASTLSEALDYFRKAYDPVNGGLQRATKFPSSLPIRFLLREHRRTGSAEALAMVEQTLDAMRRGGLYDHVGGGFHRYTTEATWTVPHFEKMLYDNALLVPAFLEAYQATGNRDYAAVARDVLDYVLREMTSAEGTFYSATDADSEGEEGRFFVWSPEELRAAVGDELDELALLAYGVRYPGNFEDGRSVLRRDASPALLAKKLGSTEAKVELQLETIRDRLRVARAERVPPLRDEKQIVSWNGLMISALVRGGQVLGEARFLAAAEKAAATLLQNGLRDGVLTRYLRDGKAYGVGLLSDYAFFEASLLDLFEATSEPRWLDAALALQRDLDRRFWDDVAGGYFVTPVNGEALLVREKTLDDGAVPSGNSVQVMNLLRLHSLVSDELYLRRTKKSLLAFSDFLKRFPAGAGEMLLAVDYFLDTPKEILIVAPTDRAEAEPFSRELMQRFLPNRVHLALSGEEAKSLAAKVPLLEGKRAIRGKVTAFVCVNQTCERPVSTLEDFAKQLGRKPEEPTPLPF